MYTQNACGDLLEYRRGQDVQGRELQRLNMESIDKRKLKKSLSGSMWYCTVRGEEGTQIKSAAPQCLFDRVNIVRLLEELVSTNTAVLARQLVH